MSNFMLTTISSLVFSLRTNLKSDGTFIRGKIIAPSLFDTTFLFPFLTSTPPLLSLALFQMVPVSNTKQRELWVKVNVFLSLLIKKYLQPLLKAMPNMNFQTILTKFVPRFMSMHKQTRCNKWKQQQTLCLVPTMKNWPL
jgi:hypothetical protein